MEPVVFVEILGEPTGKVRERIRVDRFPVTLGRAYDNHIILDDRFVSPRHAAIDLDEQGNIVVNDCQSENGLYRAGSWRRVTQAVIASETTLRLGRTSIRFRTPQCPVSPTALDNLGPGRLSDLLRSGRVFALLLVALVGFDALETYLTTFTQVRPERVLLQLFPSALTVALWAGLWALAGRIFSHTSSFVSHGNLACLALIALYLFDLLSGYYGFAFSADLSATWLQYLGWTAVGSLLLFGHLRNFLATPSVRLALFSAGVVGALIVLGVTAHQVMDEEIYGYDRLRYNHDLKPPGFKLASDRSVEEFLADAAKLKNDADQAIQKD